jgi:hypothetical protein
MGFETRSTTRGNTPLDYTRLREDLKKVSPAIAATLRNAVPKNGQSVGKDEGKGNETINPYKLNRLSNMISNNINAVTDLRVITPYIDKAELIWNTILFHPNGKQDKILTYDTQTTKLKNTAMHTELLTVWDNYYTNDYKIEPELSPWANDILWNTGSVCLFNLSRPGLDYLINGSELDPNTPEGRSGQEAFVNQAKQHLESEFVTEEGTGRRLARNKGFFVRDPHKKDGVKAVSGLEALLGSRPAYDGVEFNIFSKEEDPNNDIKITLTDNLSLLYLQKFSSKARDNDINSVMGVESFNHVIQSAMKTREAEEKAQAEKDKASGKKSGKKTGKDKDGELAQTTNLTDEQFDQVNRAIYRDRHVRSQSMQYVKANDSLSVQPYGRGLVWHVPSEAVIPVRHNGGSGKVDDYIFLLDDEGNFLKNTDDAEFYQSSKKNQESITNKNKNGSENQLISSLRQVQEGKPCDFDMSEFAELSKSNLLKRFVSAVVSGKGDGVSITIDEETNKIFLARMFRRQGVRCLYVPGEAVTYMALKTNRMGIGQSLTQLAKMHIARLAAFDVADTLANIEAAQPHTLMNITPEAEDADPQQSIAIARQTFFDNNPRLHSLLSTAQLSVPQIVDALRESSLTVKVNAGENKHVVAPDISLERYTKENFKPVDDASRQQVLNSICNYFNLPRSWLDVSDDTNNFKIEAITEHEMVSNQGVNWQTELSKFIIDFQRKHARVNGPLMQTLVQTILDNKKLWVPDSKEPLEGTDEVKVKIILADFFNSVYCSMPVPTSTETTNKLVESLEAVDKLVTSWEALSGNNVVMGQMLKILGIEQEDFSQDEIKASIKSAFMTEAFRRFNLPMPFDEIVNEGKGGGIASLVQAITHQRKNVAEFLAKFMLERHEADEKTIKSYKSKLDKALGLDQQPAPDADGLGGGGTSDEPLEDDGTGGTGPTGDPELDNLDNLDGPTVGEDDVVEEGGEKKEGEEEEEEEAPAAEPKEGDEAEPAEVNGSNDPKDPNYNPFGSNKK